MSNKAEDPKFNRNFALLMRGMIDLSVFVISINGLYLQSENIWLSTGFALAGTAVFDWMIDEIAKYCGMY